VSAVLALFVRGAGLTSKGVCDMSWRKRLSSVALISCVIILLLAPGIGLGDDPSGESETAPVIPGGIPSHRIISCPPGYIANRVTYWRRTRSIADEIRVEACVTRDGGVDTYAYLVTNLGYVLDDGSGREIGIGRFEIRDESHLESVSFTSPPGWTYHETPSYRWWQVTLGEAGLPVGESVVFTFSVPGPTVHDSTQFIALRGDEDRGLVDRGDQIVAETVGPVLAYPAPLPLAGCPEGNIGYDIGYGTPYNPGYGEIRVEECVTREGDVDTYTYTVTNLNYFARPYGAPRLGIGHFTVPNPDGVESLSTTAPMEWTFEAGRTDAWHWSVPLGDVGIWMGESVVFSFSVAGPTVDGPAEVLAMPATEPTPAPLPPDADPAITVASTGPHRWLGDEEPSGTVDDPRDIPPLTECPEGHVAYDVAYGTDSPFGNVRVEECVTREGDVDTYTYTVTNLSYAYTSWSSRYGIGEFSVPRSAGVVPLSVTIPTGWDFDSASADAWRWNVPFGEVGLWMGESVTFSFTVAGPTVDGPLEVQALPRFGRPPVPSYTIDDPVVVVLSTGPQTPFEHGPGMGVVGSTETPGDLPPPEECPDLLLDDLEVVCGCGWSPQQVWGCAIGVEVVVRNRGEADAGEFVVSLLTDEGDARKTIPGLAAGQSRRVTLDVSFEEKSCPLDYEIRVDLVGNIADCDGTNNTLQGEACCE